MKEIYSSVLVLATTKTEVIRSENIHPSRRIEIKNLLKPNLKWQPTKKPKWISFSKVIFLFQWPEKLKKQICRINIYDYFRV